MSDISDQIDAIREVEGQKLLILGHHYQRSSVLMHADEKGDSLELARKAASNPDAEKIVFCGVRFMAESADILTGSEQTVYMPEMAAGCPMARMAGEDSMRDAWDAIGGADAGWVPVVYVNSTAGIKACCGEWGGSTCTSSNAARVFDWVLSQGKRVFFLPDEHLGRNTAHDLGIDDNEIVLYDPSAPVGGISRAVLESTKVLVWKGFCLVHTAFTVDHVASVRKRIPDARIIVHPEAPCAVVRASDAHGSTSQIIKYVEDAEDGVTIVIGTENNLVERLAEEQKGRVTVKALAPSICANMSKINDRNLLDVLANWPRNNIVTVPDAVAGMACESLNTMLQF